MQTFFSQSRFRSLRKVELRRQAVHHNTGQPPRGKGLVEADGELGCSWRYASRYKVDGGSFYSVQHSWPRSVVCFWFSFALPSKVLDLALLAGGPALELLGNPVDRAVQLADLVVQHLARHLQKRRKHHSKRTHTHTVVGVRREEGGSRSAKREEALLKSRDGRARVMVAGWGLRKRRVFTSKFSLPSPKSFFILSLLSKALETCGAKRKPKTPKTVPPTRTPDQNPPAPSLLLPEAATRPALLGVDTLLSERPCCVSLAALGLGGTTWHRPPAAVLEPATLLAAECAILSISPFRWCRSPPRRSLRLPLAPSLVVRLGLRAYLCCGKKKKKGDFRTENLTRSDKLSQTSKYRFFPSDGN